MDGKSLAAHVVRDLYVGLPECGDDGRESRDDGQCRNRDHQPDEGFAQPRTTRAAFGGLDRVSHVASFLVRAVR